MGKKSFGAFLALLVASPVLAKTHISFAAYEGQDAALKGSGGTKVVENGADYWTTGDPPRPFHYLGVLTVDGPKDPLKRKDVAEAVRKAGGDAAVLKRSDSRVTGSRAMGMPMPAGVGLPGTAFARSRVEEATTSVFAVIRYGE